MTASSTGPSTVPSLPITGRDLRDPALAARPVSATGCSVCASSFERLHQ